MSSPFYTKVIPSVTVPSITDYAIEPVDEKIVSLKEAGFYAASQYNKQWFPVLTRIVIREKVWCHF